MSAHDLKLEEIVNPETLRRKLNELADSTDENYTSPTVRKVVLQALKDALVRGRANAEGMLMKDGGGTLCAKRLSFLMDTLIEALFEFATTKAYPMINPSKAENMAIVAVGGYGRGGLAPGSDIDLLFLLPYKQTPWGEQVVEYMLYMLWDMGLKVGHSTRNIDECIRLAREDMTIRTAVLDARFLTGNRELFKSLVGRFDEEIVRIPGLNSFRPSLPSATSATARQAKPAIWSSRTSRKARAGSATCIRCSGSPSIFTASRRRKSWSSSVFCRGPN